jgi:aminoglycoside phosphotransferase (APT) family kinase protein
METWSIEAIVGGREEHLVLRRDMGANMNPDALTRAQEFALLQRAYDVAVPAPRPRWCLDKPTEHSRAFFIMDRVDGESVGRRVVRQPELADARKVLAREMGAALARIHAIPLDASLAFLPRPRHAEDPYDHCLRVVRAMIAALRRDNPTWAYALRWLDVHRPPPDARGPVAVLHGDFRIGNLLVDRKGLGAVIDWEFAYVGDVHADLAWPLMRDWRFEQDHLHVGGVGTLDDYLAGYDEAGGARVDRRALAWWELAGNLRWSVTCHAQADRHLSGQDVSVELASLGRKSFEVEWEIVHLIERYTREKTL